MRLRSIFLAAATLLAMPAAHGTAGQLPVAQADPTGDVNIFDGGGTKPTTGQRNTIDLKRFTVTRGDGGVRFTFKIARITGTKTFDQIVSVQFQKTGRDGFVLDMQANPQDRHGSAYSDGTFCTADVTTSRRTGTVRVDVPDDCVPSGEGVLRVSTYTQEKHGSGPGYSEDPMRVKGTVALR